MPILDTALLVKLTEHLEKVIGYLEKAIGHLEKAIGYLCGFPLAESA